MRRRIGILTAIAWVAAATSAAAQDAAVPPPAPSVAETAAPAAESQAGPRPAGLDVNEIVSDATRPSRVASTIQVLLLVTVLALAPSILVMMTSFTRIIVVLGLLRQAMATQQLPPNQVLIGLALFMTFVVMGPVYSQVHDDAVAPYLAGEIDQPTALAAATTRVRAFMIRQVEAGENTDDVYLFLNDELAARPNLMWGDVPTMTLIPAYVISELKIAFLMGFRVYLPFLIIDMVIASILISMGMLMLPPVLISLPFKLLLFVLVDGWHLVVRTLMVSFD